MNENFERIYFIGLIKNMQLSNKLFDLLTTARNGSNK